MVSTTIFSAGTTLLFFWNFDMLVQLPISRIMTGLLLCHSGQCGCAGHFRGHNWSQMIIRGCSLQSPRIQLTCLGYQLKAYSLALISYKQSTWYPQVCMHCSVSVWKRESMESYGSLWLIASGRNPRSFGGDNRMSGLNLRNADSLRYSTAVLAPSKHRHAIKLAHGVIY